MITNEMLLEFCSRDENRIERIGKPFTHGEWTYATDGRLMIRVEAREEWSENALAPVAESVNFFTKYSWFTTEEISVPGDLPTWPEKAWCSDCEGSGDANCCECGQRVPCVECSGKGVYRVEGLPIPLAGAFFDVRFLKKMARLPGLRELSLVDPKPPLLVFTFNGGQGIVCGFSMGPKPTRAEFLPMVEKFAEGILTTEDKMSEQDQAWARRWIDVVCGPEEE